MNIYEVQNRQTKLPVLMEIWETSVRATHLFLSEEEIRQIKEYVPQALLGVEHLLVIEHIPGVPAGFMGVEDGRLEMIFLSPEMRGKGLGKALLQYGIKNYNIQELTVNEQNPQAVGFYEYLGFVTCKRTSYDEQGNQYPLLYMKRNAEDI